MRSHQQEPKIEASSTLFLLKLLAAGAACASRDAQSYSFLLNTLQIDLVCVTHIKVWCSTKQKCGRFYGVVLIKKQRVVLSGN